MEIIRYIKFPMEILQPVIRVYAEKGDCLSVWLLVGSAVMK